MANDQPPRQGGKGGPLPPIKHRPPPTPPPRPHIDCAKVKVMADHFTATGKPELAKELLTITGCG